MASVIQVLREMLPARRKRAISMAVQTSGSRRRLWCPRSSSFVLVRIGFMVARLAPRWRQNQEQKRNMRHVTRDSCRNTYMDAWRVTPTLARCFRINLAADIFDDAASPGIKLIEGEDFGCPDILSKQFEASDLVIVADNLRKVSYD
jgi:hypothetical protein